MSVGIIAAIVVIIMILVIAIASGVGYYYKKASGNTTRVSSGTPSSAAIIINHANSTSGPNSAVFSSAATSGAVAATQIAPAIAQPATAQPATAQPATAQPAAPAAISPYAGKIAELYNLLNNLRSTRYVFGYVITEPTLTNTLRGMDQATFNNNIKNIDIAMKKVTDMADNLSKEPLTPNDKTNILIVRSVVTMIENEVKIIMARQKTMASDAISTKN